MMIRLGHNLVIETAGQKAIYARKHFDREKEREGGRGEGRVRIEGSKEKKRKERNCDR